MSTFGQNFRRQLMAVITLIVILLFNHGHCELPKRTNRYLAHLFNKYGSNGVISFEGLEHLMHNLGLGGLEFNPTHTIDEHRPVGFQLPDIIEDFAHGETNTIVEHIENATSTSEKQDNSVISMQSSPKVDSSGHQPGALTPIENTDEPPNSVHSSQGVTDDNQFRLLHDPKHRHPRHHDHDHPLTKTCLSPKALIQLYVNDPSGAHHGASSGTSLHKRSIDDDDQTQRSKRAHGDSNEFHEPPPPDTLTRVQITPSIFMSMCPALLVQIEQGACNEQAPVAADHSQRPGVAWASATLSVFLISMCGLVGIAMVPLAKSAAYQDILRFLVACAIGTLCGDALMHLLPHAMSPHGHDVKADANRLSDMIDEDDEPIWLCACAFLSALLMYSIETLLPLIGNEHHHGHSHGHNHSHHSHSHGPPKRDNVIDVYQQQHQPQEQQQPQQQQPQHQTNATDRNGNAGGEETDIDLEMTKSNAEENAMVKDTKNHPRPYLTPVAFMVIIGDGLHNLTDGMAIGAAFGTDPVTGMATAFAVLCHELPHELGDFALLLQTGVSIRRAVVLNVVSSILSFIGMIFGLVIAGVHGGFVRWIYAGTSGTFLYIAMADLIPELGRVQVSAKTVFVQIFGILLGGIIMLFIALNEDRLKFLFK